MTCILKVRRHPKNIQVDFYVATDSNIIYDFTFIFVAIYQTNILHDLAKNKNGSLFYMAWLVEFVSVVCNYNILYDVTFLYQLCLVLKQY